MLTRGDLSLFMAILAAKYGLSLALFGEFYAPVFDNLDSVVPYDAVSGRFWASGFDASVFNVFIGGNSQWYHYFQAVSPQTLLYALLSPSSAYLTTELLGLALSFVGAKLMFSLFEIRHHRARILALIFAFSVSYSSYGLGLQAAPLIVWIALDTNSPTKWKLAATVVVGLSSSLAEHGFFLPLAILAIMWIFNRWDRLVQAFWISVLFLCASIVTSLGLIYTSLSGQPTHRMEMLSDATAPTIGGAVSKALAHVFALDGAAHALVVPAIFAAFTLVAGAFSGRREIRTLTAKVALFLLIAGLVGAYEDQIEAWALGPLKSIQFSRLRLYSAIPLLILAGIIWQNSRVRWARGILGTGLSIYSVMAFLAMSGINPDNLKASVPESRMPQLLSELRTRKFEALFSSSFYASYGITLSSFRKSGETFSSHFRDRQYACLKQSLGPSRVLSVGLDPMIAPYHGIGAIDGYHNLYPLEYKHRFSKIIKDQLEVSPRGPNYFYHWGSRLNTFVTSPDEFLLDLDAARALGATALISAFELPDLGDPAAVCRDPKLSPIFAYKL